jgi:50S ribosomal protein L16 3-hydroxylase
MTTFFNTPLSQQQFLTQYWQQKPLLIRNAWPDFEPGISPEELAGLACEADIESRLIEEQGQDGPWQLRHGPFSDDDFMALPATHWTLLVQDVDKHVAALASIMQRFNFIPEWRRDDLMISFAPQGGSVGPHIDGYDVFLLQAQGTRRWQISDEPLAEAEFIDGLDLKILRHFEPDQSWDLEPGDMLYLPPHYAHHGVALNDCMTFSIGFRAPSQIELLDAFMQTLSEYEGGQARYRDPGLPPAENDKEIDAASLKRFKQSLIDCIESSDEWVLDAVGRLLTETKPSLQWQADLSSSEMTDTDTLEQRFEAGEQLLRNPYIRIAWARESGAARLFAAGETVPEVRPELVTLLTGDDPITKPQWHALRETPGGADSLLQLLELGVWQWS